MQNREAGQTTAGAPGEFDSFLSAPKVSNIGSKESTKQYNATREVSQTVAAADGLVCAYTYYLVSGFLSLSILRVDKDTAVCWHLHSHSGVHKLPLKQQMKCLKFNWCTARMRPAFFHHGTQQLMASVLPWLPCRETLLLGFLQGVY